jgi:predicted HTH domain antitoxin
MGRMASTAPIDIEREAAYTYTMMETYQVTVELPQSAKNLLSDAEGEARQLLAMKIYRNGGVSVAYAAEIAGMNRFAFTDLLADYHIPIRGPTYEQAMADADDLECSLAP